ncbi:hypothetical protein [Nonlabens agnitus]|uniref:Lipocalin-like domain-containing protein n=1 Tax=Nonlabens agnitus TaxID=870484 RepID=A0A2S9WUK9_9FLAO|nr:hypothetical protein [Nonlabens agnitus]PRP67162.1 hypothetical protein BST86_08650 [Nonlabens agnitus]
MKAVRVYSILLGLVLLTTAFQCDEDSVFNQDLVGTWEHVTTDGDIERKEFFNFRADGTYIYSVTGIDLGTQEVLGFQKYEEGRWVAINGNKLELYLEVFEISTDGGYTTRENLERTNSGDPVYFYTLNESGQELTLEPDCPPNASCIGPVTYLRIVQEI